MNAQLEYMMRVMRVNQIVGNELLRHNKIAVPQKIVLTQTNKQKRKVLRDMKRKGIKVTA